MRPWRRGERQGCGHCWVRDAEVCIQLCAMPSICRHLPFHDVLLLLPHLSAVMAIACHAHISACCTAAACRIAGPTSAVLASKCLKGKPATVGKAGEACMLLIELEQQAAVIEAVLKAFGDKVPKVVLAAVDIVLQAVRWVGLSSARR